MITQDKVPYPSNPEETKLILERGTGEMRMRCNVCGEVFCYSARDLVRSRELKKEVSDTRKIAAMEALFGTRLAANQHTGIADNLGTQIIDYSKCPKCNSTDLTEIGEEEFKAIIGFSANNSTAPVSLWMKSKSSKNCWMRVLSHRKNLMLRKSSFWGCNST